jgi:hypothetical protein
VAQLLLLFAKDVTFMGESACKQLNEAAAAAEKPIISIKL